MRRIHLGVFVAALAMSSCCGWVEKLFQDPDLREADGNFQEGLFDEAYEKYDEIWKTSDDEDVKWKAFYRSVESLGFLYRYGEAAQLLYETPPPAEMPHRARYLWLKAEMLQNFSRQYSSIQEAEVVEGEEGEDVFRKTPAQVREDIIASYEELWKMRDELVKWRIQEQDYFLDVQDIDEDAWPTAFDYVVHSWAQFLVDDQGSALNEKTDRLVADDLLVAEYDTQVDMEAPPALLAAQIMEEASRYETRKRREAAQRWKVRRLMMPFQTGYFEMEEPERSAKKAEDVLVGWFSDFTSAGAKAEAGYHAADFMNGREAYVDAVKMCKKVEDRYDGTYAAHRARELREDIQEPHMELMARTAMPPAKGALSVRTRNKDRVWLRAYRVEPTSYRKDYETQYSYLSGWSNLFSYMYEDWLDQFMDDHEPAHAWTQDVQDPGDYTWVETVVDSPDLTEGVYVVVASEKSSFSPGRVLLNTVYLNVTNLVLVGTTGPTAQKTLGGYNGLLEKRGAPRATVQDDLYRFYTVDARTGEPVQGADVNVDLRANYVDETRDLTTDDSGMATMAVDVSLSPRTFTKDDSHSYGGDSNWYSADPLASKDGSYSYWSSSHGLSYAVPNPIEVFLTLDRPIYRPGHTVHAKAVCVRRTPTGFRALEKGTTVTFRALDGNSKEFFTVDTKLREYGSATVKFPIPAGKLLGQYQLRAFVDTGRFTGVTTSSFRVEEYTQPEFEVQLDEAEQAWKYGKPVKVQGTVTYYFGGPVPDADVKYVIRRQSYVPWFYRYWFGSSWSSSAQEVATGDLVTDDEGRFVIDFTPQQPPRRPWQSRVPQMSSYTFEVEARDAGGRTIHTSQSYRAGEKALYFTVSPQRGFFDASEKPTLDTSLLTINDTPQEGKSTWEVFRLADEPAKPLDEEMYAQGQSSWGWIPPLDVQLSEVKSAKKVDSGSAVHGEDGKAVVQTKTLGPGVYRIVMKTQDPWGGDVEQERLFVVAGEAGQAVPVPAASVTLVQDAGYQPGQKARVVMGSALANTTYRMEIWAGRYLHETRIVHQEGPVQIEEIPVLEDYLGGFTVRWFGVKDLQVHHGEMQVSVPYPDKKLTVNMDPFQEDLRPGQEYTWSINLASPDGKPARGEALALMYDRALEYYATGYERPMSSLWSGSGAPILGIDSIFVPGTNTVWVDESILEKVGEVLEMPPDPPRPPGLRTWESWVEGRDGFLSNFRSAKYETLSQTVMEEGAMEKAPPAPEEAEASDSPGAKPAPKKGKAKGDSVSRGVALDGLAGKDMGGEGQGAPDVEARGAFSDTAFFRPFVTTGGDGQGAFSFVAPEQLTSWRVKVFAFTKDMAEGSIVDEVVTRKELMVRADIPRFFREKDRGTVTAIVHNESEATMEGDLYIDIRSEEQSIAQAVGIDETTRHYSIQPHSLASFDFAVDVPRGVGSWKVKVTAVSGELTDAEERVLPILPSRQRLIESAFVSLEGDESKQLKIELKDDPTRISESMVVQVDPQLALSLINTIPFLVEYPYDCVEQTLNRYVPLAILNEIYRKYPELRSAVSKVPRRDTLTPPWEQDDPRRLITLMETPWVRQSEGYKPSFPMTDLLDPGIVEQEKQIAMDKLRMAQMGSGAFPWWPGGQESPYMTLLVLAGLAEARHYGVDVPGDMVDAALGYVNDEIPKRLTEDVYDLSLTAYAGWVVTSFSADEYTNAAQGHAHAKKWAKHLEKYIHALTPFGKAYLAAIHHRLGDQERAEEILDMIMDSAHEDPLVGVYWQPEKYSWVWYSDSVEKHAFILRTLAEIRPDDERIPGMVQWLLFNRKGNQWKSTKASAAAVFALLSYMEQTGALASTSTFQISWVDTTEKFVVKPDDFYEEPIRFIKTGDEITDAHSSVTVEKDGKGLAFASLVWIYTTDQLPEASAPGLLNVQRNFYRRVKKGDEYHLVPVKSGQEVKVGDEVVIKLKITSKSQFEFMHVKDPRGAGFEGETLLSGWKYEPLWIYEEPRDSLTNFFMDWLPAGEYVLTYTVRPTKPGSYRVGATILQSMYAPEMTAHSAGHVLTVTR